MAVYLPDANTFDHQTLALNCYLAVGKRSFSDLARNPYPMMGVHLLLLLEGEALASAAGWVAQRRRAGADRTAQACARAER